ncbi:MAG: TrkA-related ion transporter, partial [Myxococcota bacterium]
LGGGAEFLMLRAVRVLRILRLLRLLRLLKIVRHGYALYRLAVTFRIWVSALIFHYHLQRLARLILIAGVFWVTGANALYISEAVADSAVDSPYVRNYWLSYWGVIIFLISGMDAPEPVSLGARAAVTLLLVTGIVLVAVFTGEVVAILVRSAERRGRIALKPPGLKLAEHIVILGRNEHLGQLIHQIHAALGGRHYILVVCEDAEAIPSPGPESHRRVFGLQGDPSDDATLDATNLEDARRVIILSDARTADSMKRDNVSLMHAIASIARNRSLPMVVELKEPESLRYARSIETADCLVSRHFGEKLMSQAVLNAGVTEIYNELMSFSGYSNEFYRVVVPPMLVGKTFREAQEYFLDYDDEAILLVGIEPGHVPRAYTGFRLCVADASGAMTLPDHVLRAEDRLIVFGLERPSFDTRKPEEAWQGDELPRR